MQRAILLRFLRTLLYLLGCLTSCMAYFEPRYTTSLLAFVGRCRQLQKPSTNRLCHHMSLSSTASSYQRPTVLVLAGPTAVGKSDVAARLGAGIVISADSVQAYQGVQIGANKPTAQERAITPHLLIDVASADISYNAAEWTKDALYCIRKLLCVEDKDEGDESNRGTDPETIARRAKIDREIEKARATRGIAKDKPVTPVVVGGTMMYLQWLVHGRPDALRPTPSALKKATKMVTAFEEKEDWEGAIQHVQAMGEKFAQQSSKLFDRDYYRLRRIMEVAYTVDELRRNQNEDGNDSDTLLAKLYSGQREGGLLSMNEYDVRCFFLCPDDRMVHSKIVDERCEQMLQRGLLRETTELSLAGALPDMATKSIGYRQTLEYLTRQGYARESDTDCFWQYVKDFTTATRQYSKRQMQWFRKDKHFVFVPVQVARSKELRVTAAANEIRRLASLPRSVFDSKERLCDDSLSAATRQQNEKQGKGMKVYRLEFKILLNGSEALKQVVKEADLCTNQLRAKRTKTADNHRVLPPT